jgi:two-component system nitrogen regulation response regulator GlnG
MERLEKIWLIDDDEDEHVLVRHALEKAKSSIALEVFSDASRAMQALERLEDGFPGLIVCDLKMPGMSGIEFLDWLRASPFSVIPIVIRSNSGLQPDVNAAFEHGANCYVRKGSLKTLEKNLKLLLEFWSTTCTPAVTYKPTVRG